MYINYRTGKDFFLDNNEYILSDELQNQFLYTNAKSSWDIQSSLNNFHIKVFNDDREIFMIKSSPHLMIIIGAESLIPEVISSLNELHYSFSGILGSRSITDSFITE